MAITDPGDAVPGELITAAWGDIVRADLLALSAGLDAVTRPRRVTEISQGAAAVAVGTAQFSFVTRDSDIGGGWNALPAGAILVPQTGWWSFSLWATFTGTAVPANVSAFRVIIVSDSTHNFVGGFAISGATAVGGVSMTNYVIAGSGCQAWAYSPVSVNVALNRASFRAELVAI